MPVDTGRGRCGSISSEDSCSRISASSEATAFLEAAKANATLPMSKPELLLRRNSNVPLVEVFGCPANASMISRPPSLSMWLKLSAIVYKSLTVLLTLMSCCIGRGSVMLLWLKSSTLISVNAARWHLLERLVEFDGLAQLLASILCEIVPLECECHQRVVPLTHFTGLML